MTNHNLRKNQVEQSIGEIRKCLSDGLTVEKIDQAKQIMLELAANQEIFNWQEFPLPDDDEIFKTYLVHQDEDGGYALYVNSSLPGQHSPPHDHGGSWAIVAAVEGEELHRVYQLNDDRQVDDVSPVKQVGEILVKPGNAISMLADGIHSIHMETDAPLLHLHLYGWGFEHQGARNEFNMETGEVKNFKLEEVGEIIDMR